MDVELHKKLSGYVEARKYSRDKTSIDATVQEAVRKFFDDELPAKPEKQDTSLGNREHAKHVAAFVRMLDSDDERSKRIVLAALEPWIERTAKTKKTA